MTRFACPHCKTVSDEQTDACPACGSPFVPPDSASVEIAPCPECRARLSVAETDLGGDVECPNCKAVYTAKRLKRRLSEGDGGDTEPNRRGRDEDEDRPRRKKNRRPRPETNNAANTANTLGKIGLFAWCCPLVGLAIGILAIVYGMKAKSETDGAMGNIGVIRGTICVVLSILNLGLGAILQLTK